MNSKITIVAATFAEIAPLQEYLNSEAVHLAESTFQVDSTQIDILITGIGIVHTMYSLMEYLHDHKPVLWIQAGIGGAFDRSFEISETVIIESETLYGFGAQDKDGKILTPFELSWWKPNEFPFEDELLFCKNIPLDVSLRRASGMTTLHAHGNESQIVSISQHRHGQIESMEGFPFFFVSLMKQIPFLSLRGISNYIEPRNKANWKIEEAIARLNESLIEILQNSRA